MPVIYIMITELSIILTRFVMTLKCGYLFPSDNFLFIFSFLYFFSIIYYIYSYRARTRRLFTLLFPKCRHSQYLQGFALFLLLFPSCSLFLIVSKLFGLKTQLLDVCFLFLKYCQIILK